MPQPNFIILYVANTAVSAAFHGRLLGKPPVEQSPGFALFALDSGVMLGLWARADVVPSSDTPPGGGELAFAVDSAAHVDAVCEQWRGWDIPVIQAPEAMDFGYTVTALDPDGHRVRVFCPGS